MCGVCTAQHSLTSLPSAVAFLLVSVDSAQSRVQQSDGRTQLSVKEGAA